MGAARSTGVGAHGLKVDDPPQPRRRPLLWVKGGSIECWLDALAERYVEIYEGPHGHARQPLVSDQQ